MAVIIRCSLLGGNRDRNRIVDGLCVGLPAIAVVVLISMETGFTIHLRYALPAYPFLFVWTGSLWQPRSHEKTWRRVLLNSLLVWTAVSSIAAVPHSHCHFNELAGGSRGGANWLLDSNIDYGEDSLDLRSWCSNHPIARPLYTAVRSPVPMSMICSNAIEDWDTQNLRPGWYVVSVHLMHSSSAFRQFTALQPHEIISPSLYVYWITVKDRTSIADWRMRRNDGRRIAGISPLTF